MRWTARALREWTDAPLKERAATAPSMALYLRAAVVTVGDMRAQVAGTVVETSAT